MQGGRECFRPPIDYPDLLLNLRKALLAPEFHPHRMRIAPLSSDSIPRPSVKRIRRPAKSAAKAPTINESQFVPAEVHRTPPAIMKLDLPKRINALVRKHGSPILVIDKSRLISEYNHFRKLLPRVQLYYAIKANPHMDVIKTFAELGGSFDCASEGEVRHVLAQGVGPERIIFANTVKRPEALAFAKKNKVDLCTFDNEPELYKIAKHAPGCRVLCRLKVSNLGSIVELSLKFGADQDQIVPMLLKAKTLGLRPEGICFHSTLR